MSSKKKRSRGREASSLDRIGSGSDCGDSDNPPQNDKKQENHKPKKQKPTASSSKQKKKLKSTQSPRRHRPPPPPNPPGSLVKLLQKDPQVLSYFQSLQSNLEADVQIWKDRAQQYQRDNKNLERKLDRLQKETIKNNRSTKKSSPSQKRDTKPPSQVVVNTEKKKVDQLEQMEQLENDSNRKEEEMSVSNPTNKRGESPLHTTDDKKEEEEEEDGVPIDDSMFLFDSDDSDDDSDVKDDGEKRAETRTPHSGSVAEKNAKDSNSGQQQPRLADFALESSNSSTGSNDESDNSGVGFLDHSDIGNRARKRRPQSAQQQKTRRSHLLLPKEVALLCDTFLDLERLGVRLVKKEVIVCPNNEQEKDSSNLDKVDASGDDDDQLFTFDTGVTENGKTNPEETHGAAQSGSANSKDEAQPQKRHRWVPRPDDHVATDIVSIIHNLSRIQFSHKDLKKDYPPFQTGGLIPACNDSYMDKDTTQTIGGNSNPSHPILKGKELLFRALVVMDTYCSYDRYSDEEWSGLFEPEYDDDENKKDETLKMSVGLRGRARLVRRLIQSLDGEIRDCWPIQDRSDSFKTPAFHVESLGEQQEAQPQDDQEKGNIYAQPDDGNPVLDSKIQGRLSNIVERGVLVQIVVGFYLSCNDQEKVANLIWRYILSTAPCPNEDYPKLAPAQSFVVLESMLVPQKNIVWWQLGREHDESNVPLSLWSLLLYDEDKSNRSAEIAAKTLILCLRTTASIWRTRESLAQNNRTKALAAVEVAAFERLVQLGLISKEAQSLDHQTEASQEAQRIRQELESWSEWTNHMLKDLTFQLCLILGEDSVPGLLERHNLVAGQDSRLVPASLAVKEMETRLIESHQNEIGRQISFPPFSYLLDSSWAALETNYAPSASVENVSRVLQAATTLANGLLVAKCADLLMTRLETMPRNKLFPFLSLLSRVSQVPMVRVINLRGRPDRMRAFYSQAISLGLTLVHAVAILHHRDSDNDQPQSVENTPDGFFFGKYAVDGSGKWVEATDKISNEVGDRLNSLLAPQWRPADLHLFDTNAPTNQNLVYTSPSEQACALSHLASWKGALRSFQMVNRGEASGGILRRPSVLRRMFHLSGFAEGAALHASNRNMDPVPVCVILEDDAVLCDRFTERLQSLLQDLPRDFHFCSLGYSRPKTAPIVQFRKHVGIPTNLYYLTGYVISEAGAKHLLQSLPIVGPVDSWIGLKMTSNFDNVFESIVGIGQHKTSAEPLAPRDLCTILTFRAFCAMQPLCVQRVGSNSNVGFAGRSWRQRDTDIEYSGSRAYMAGQR